QDLAQKHEHLRILTIPRDQPRQFPGKKDALSHGLSAARHPWVLLTDADCYPRSPHWIRTMASRAGEYSVICGPGLYEKNSGGLNLMIQGETLNSYLMAFALADSGFPYLALGRNLLCRRQDMLAAQQDPLWART